MIEHVVLVLALGAAAIFLATFLGGVVGFAYGLVALPLLLIIGLPLADVVFINLLVGLTTRVFVLARRHHDINRKRTTMLVVGSLPGVGIGLLVRDVVSGQVIQAVAGIVTVVAVAALVYSQRRRRQSASRSPAVLAAGGLGGFLGATTSLNGVPPALVLAGDRASARSFVADLAAYFVVGNAVILLALGLSGHAPSSAIWVQLAVWIPVGLLGNLTGIGLGPLLPQAAFRRLTLTVIVVCGVTATVLALW